MVGAVTKRYFIRYLESIRVSSPPATTAYTEGDALSLAGLAVTAVFNDGEQVISNYETSPAEGEILTEDDTEITVTYTYGVITKTAVIPITVEAAPVTLTISGSGNTNYCYVSVGGTKYTSAQSITVDKGTEVTFGVYGYSSTYYGEVRVDGSQKLKVTNRSTQTYTWTADYDATIAMTYTSSSSRRNGRISVTTS